VYDDKRISMSEKNIDDIDIVTKTLLLFDIRDWYDHDPETLITKCDYRLKKK